MMAGKTTRRCREGFWGFEGAKRQPRNRKKKFGAAGRGAKLMAGVDAEGKAPHPRWSQAPPCLG